MGLEQAHFFALPTLIVLVALVGLSAGGNCTATNRFRMQNHSGNLVVSSSGPNVTLSPAIDGEIQPTSMNITVRLADVMERARLDRKNDRCNVPAGYKDPWTTTDDDGLPYATILSTYSMDNFDCHTVYYETVKSDVLIQTIRTDYYLTSNYSFHMSLLFELVNDTLIEFPNNDTTYTGGIVYTYRWIPERLKMTANITGFPFVGEALPAVNSSFVSLHFDMGFTIRRGFGNMTDGNASSLIYETLDEPRQTLFYEFEKSYLFDGVPRTNFKARTKFSPLDLSLIAPGLVLNQHFWVGIPICDDIGGHFNTIIYDPQLSSLFNLGSNPSTTPVNTPAAKTNRVTAIVAGTVVGSVVIALAAFSLAAWNVPKLRQKIIPSTVKMSHPANSAKVQASSLRTTESETRPSTALSQASKPESAPKSGWTTASKPAVE